jgi:hypothetical protein
VDRSCKIIPSGQAERNAGGVLKVTGERTCCEISRLTLGLFNIMTMFRIHNAIRLAATRENDANGYTRSNLTIGQLSFPAIDGIDQFSCVFSNVKHVSERKYY